LPHVPESLRLVLRAAAQRQDRQVRADARHARDVHAERGFCGKCGTPLTIHDVGSDRIYVSLGSLDEPEKHPPQMQYGVESRLSWFDALTRLPGDKSTEDHDPETAAKIAASNHQHPDHDTAAWPPERKD
jgi:hypothetical protein